MLNNNIKAQDESKNNKTDNRNQSHKNKAICEEEQWDINKKNINIML